MPDIFLERTPLPELLLLRADIEAAGVVTVIENGFLQRINKEIDIRVAACQQATAGYIEALAGKAGIEPATIPLTAGSSTD